MGRYWLVLLALLAPAEVSAADGGALFKKKCSACHQRDGKGIKGAFPALAGNAFVQGEARPVVGTVLSGRGGMPAWKASLSDEEVAAILTYVRSAWGNQAAAVSPALVTDVRKEITATEPHDLGN